MGDRKRVIPLESNPAIFNLLAKKLGLSPVLGFHDVFSITEPDLLAMIPQPVFAVVMLFPLTKGYEQYRVNEDQQKEIYQNEKQATVKWFKQTIGNGCGLYALLHVLANLPNDFILDHLILLEFLMKRLGEQKSVEDTARLVESLENTIQLDENFGTQGQTSAPDPSELVDLHFITFVKGKDNHVYELDGRRQGPIDLGEYAFGDDSNIINDPHLIDKIKFYMDNADEENKHNFAMIALGPSDD